MNRFILNGIDALKPEMLPPLKREGPARILFLSIHALGWKTFGQQLELYAAKRDDVDACHIQLRPPPWMKVLNHQFPGMPHHLVHPNTTWRWLIGSWFKNKKLPLGHFDVVHVSPFTAAGAAARLRKGSSFRLSVASDCNSVLWRELNGRSREQNQEDRSELKILRECDLIVPWSEWLARSLRDDYQIPADRIQVCTPAAVDASELNAMPTRRAESGALVKILFVGNDWTRKGGPQLLRWHQAHFADRAELHVVSSLAVPEKGAKNVVWHGAVAHDELLTSIFPEMDLFVFPTQLEMLGLVIIEAATFGLPVVSSRLAAIPELVVDGQTGFLCDRQDETAFVNAMERLISDPVLRANMSAAAREFARSKFNPSQQYGPLFDRFVALADER